ncbi:putative hydrolase, CocE/NonD family [Saccharomonospora marina XMU15]|uniref:Putative hydrolase, CocE/NonD family n=1 Tax=Saccharomonospora marina XMU15 TaxID=882083 RepID=H5X3E0_9PSEU|nr:CocE/NonD family hydrolase [Saccharomonospora marina]EHR49874.1 putative hydrolase, CocE/NonD family [Saccharomonospora marina XMU15]
MRTVYSLPYDIVEEDNVSIPVSDGTRLAARIWRPVASDHDRFPAIVEYIPYRKRDFTAVRDSIHHPYLAGHGYCCVRVDLRGTGESEGVLTDEYLEREQLDAEDVLEWVASAPWCTGRVGMMGISWGAFSALQVAARRPASLYAIVIASFTDDRYADDMHYMGGCLLSDNLAEAGTMFAHSTLPPDPAVVGEQWRQMWLQRLEGARPWVTEWLRHQHRDDYWRHASVCENYGDVRCPVLASSGWADGYSNAVMRLLRQLDVPRKGLVGPWSHKFPHLGEPGPAIGYLQEVVRWWDHWLKDIDNGVLDGPMLYAWMQDSVPPSTSYEQRPGRWVGEPCWPSPHVRSLRFPLDRHRLAERRGQVPERELRISSPLSVGQFAGKWASYNAPPDLPYDQREEDGGSLVFETDPLPQTCEILGAPVVELDVSADRPTAMIAARLSDVAPDGRATRVSYGLLNLTHRNGHERPECLEPGRRYRVSIELNAVAQAFPPSHRIRLSLSTSYWPLAWPPPEPVVLSVHTGSSELVLPVRPAEEPDDAPRNPFGEAEGTAPVSTTRVRPGRHRWDVTRDLDRSVSALEIEKDSGTVRHDAIGLEVSRAAHERYTSTADDFESARGETTWTVAFGRGEWQACTVTHTTLSCTESEFVVDARLDAYDGSRRLFSRDWHDVIPRDHV